MKNKQSRLVILDIGSHKLEELLVLLGPFRRQVGIYLWWAVKKTLKALLTLNFRTVLGFGRQLKVVTYYFLSRRPYEMSVIAVEPNVEVAQPYVERLSKKYPVQFVPAAVLGHDAQKPAELKTLFFYGASISSSLYQRNRLMDDSRARLCIGLTFDTLWEGLLKEQALNPDDSFLLRMNCEGAELGVIEGCVRKGLKPLCIIGSLGDVDKIHGAQAGDKTRRLIADMGTPYHYFKGDDPSTWHNMIPIWERYASAYRSLS